MYASLPVIAAACATNSANPPVANSAPLIALLNGLFFAILIILLSNLMDVFTDICFSANIIIAKNTVYAAFVEIYPLADWYFFLTVCAFHYLVTSSLVIATVHAISRPIIKPMAYAAICKRWKTSGVCGTFWIAIKHQAMTATMIIISAKYIVHRVFQIVVILLFVDILITTISFDLDPDVDASGSAIREIGVPDIGFHSVHECRF